MATVREDIEAQTTALAEEASTTRGTLNTLLASGTDTAISVLLAVLAALTANSTPTADVVSAINLLRSELSGYDANRTNEHEALMTYLSDWLPLLDTGITGVNTKLTSILSYLQTNVGPPLPLIYNQLLRLQSAIIAGYCACADGAPALPPDLLTDPVTDAGAHCQKVQYLLDKWIDGVCNAMTQLQTGIAVTVPLVGLLFGAGVIPGIDLVSIPAALLGSLVAALLVLGNAKLQAICDWLSANKEALTNMLYNSSTAAEAQSNYYAYVDANTNGVTELDLRLILKTAGWAGLFNSIYDPANSWDVSAFNPDDCGTLAVECVEYTLDRVVHGTGAGGSLTLYATHDPITGFTAELDVNTTSGFSSFDGALFYDGDLEGWTLETLSGGTVSLLYRIGDHSIAGEYTGGTVAVGDTFTFPATGNFAIYTATNIPAVIRLCPPGA
jgi:hypothetical protein